MISKALMNAVCSTRLWRVQFGVPPNCSETFVLGETPETTRGTQVLPTFSFSPPRICGAFYLE